VAHPQIAAFARLAKENAKPERLLAGQKTLLSRTMHDIRYDAVHDEMFVTNPFAQAILVFSGSANGEEPPIRLIQGPKTQLDGQIDRLEIDTVHNEIFIPDHKKILVFPLNGNGDVAPLRVISGPDTDLNTGSGAGSLAVDPVHNLIIAGTEQRGPRGGALIIFNRTDSGNVKPLREIEGPHTGITRINQIQTIPSRGLFVAAQPGVMDEQEPEGVFVGVWSENDNGDAPPRWKLGGPRTSMKKPRGVALDVKHKELIVADMRLNAVLTYYFPEIF
jgi:hypothetical protein